MKTTNNDTDKKQLANFAKYSGIAFQMFAIIGVFAFVGYKIDEYNHSKKPIITALVTLLGVLLSLYQVVRSLTKK